MLNRLYYKIQTLNDKGLQQLAKRLYSKKEYSIIDKSWQIESCRLFWNVLFNIPVGNMLANWFYSENPGIFLFNTDDGSNKANRGGIAHKAQK